jgi:hypothetical protein
VRIIFLDIDGVLNNATYLRTVKGKPSEYEIDIEKVSKLNALYSEVEYSVVISSSWRLFHDEDKLISYLKDRAGLKADIIGCTPSLSSPYMYRGNEIIAWLEQNENVYGKSHHEYYDYIILDDSSDILYWQKNNFMLVNGDVGLTDQNIYKMKRFFKYNAPLQ